MCLEAHRERTDRKCPDTRSRLISQFGIAHSLNFRFRKYLRAPNCMQLTGEIDLYRSAGDGACGYQTGKAPPSLDDLYGFTILEPRRYPAEIVAKVSDRCRFCFMIEI